MNAVLMILIVALGTSIGCQRTATGGSSDSSSTMSSLGCASTQIVDPQSLKIVGAGGANPGETVDYQLTTKSGCVNAASVSWQMVDGKAAAGGNFSTRLVRTGSYVVTAQVQTKDAAAPVTVSKTTTVSDQLTLTGPQVGMAYVSNDFTVVAPANDTVASAKWTFGDGGVSSATTTASHAFTDVGTYTVAVALTLGSGAAQTLSRQIQIISIQEGFECTNQLAISGPTALGVNAPGAYAVFIPTCLTTRITRVAWAFGDGTAAATDQSVSHAFAAVGSFPVSVSLFMSSGTTPFATLTTTVNVTQVVAPPPTDDPSGNQCASIGLTRQVTGDLYTEQVACGVDGHRVDSFRDQITQACKQSSTILAWVETSRVKTLVDRGACQGQSCVAPAASAAEAVAAGLSIVGGQFYLHDGGSATFYTSALPAGACADVSTVRSCANGVLGGNVAANLLSCQSGCAGIGASGSILAGQVIGQTLVPKTCAFGETGINDVFATLGDKLCTNGQVSTQNTRQGALVLAGSCPTYQLQATSNFTTCSADCGGQQTQIFSCVDAAGNAVSSDRCAGQEAPVVTRACDGNPAAVARVDQSVATEEGGQSKICPANQIGIIIQTRDVTTAQSYACVNHAVQLVSTDVTNGDWVSQSFCRDYVAYRCSQDSLSNAQSIARYAWLQKCQDQVPVIKDFLTQFTSYEAQTKASNNQPFLLYKNRMVYATFLNTAYSPEKPWIAPTKADAPCAVPATAYIAAVCTASCATPEQQILVEAAKTRRLAYMPIGDAWAQQIAAVATLTSASGISSKTVQKTKVDQWVTELVDGEHQILDFHLKSGGVLRLTPNHPVVTDQGTIRLASDFTVGQNLVRLGGEVDPIVDIVKTVHEGKVFNVFVTNGDPRQNVVVTNGYLNGTAFFQNDGANFVNQQILRRALIKGAF